MKPVDPYDKTTLLLDTGHFPLNTFTARAAFHQFMSGRVRALNQDGAYLTFLQWTQPEIHGIVYPDNQPVLRSAHDVWAVPTVCVATRQFYYRPKVDQKLTLKRLLNHYHNTCQYCYRKLPDHMFNRDHIFPRSKGGTNHSANIILSCMACNTRKADSTKALDIYGRQVQALPIFDLFYIPDERIRRPEWAIHLTHLPKR
jgi:hypothetical protein